MSGDLENEIKEKLYSIASISKQLLVNAENNEEAPDHDDHNDKNTNRSFVKDDPVISLELLQELSSETSFTNTANLVPMTKREKPWERGCNTAAKSISFPEPAILGKETKALG